MTTEIASDLCPCGCGGKIGLGVIKKDQICLKCGCSQDLPIGLQSCRCSCHPANQNRTESEMKQFYR